MNNHFPQKCSNKPYFSSIHDDSKNHKHSVRFQWKLFLNENRIFWSNVTTIYDNPKIPNLLNNNQRIANVWRVIKQTNIVLTWQQSIILTLVPETLTKVNILIFFLQYIFTVAVFFKGSAYVCRSKSWRGAIKDNYILFLNKKTFVATYATSSK